MLRPLVVRFADLDIALKIEQRWPGLNDRLASTIQFLRLGPDDERYGSPALREATIKQAIEETRSIDFREAIEHRPILRAAGLAVGGRCARPADRSGRPDVLADRLAAALRALGRRPLAAADPPGLERARDDAQDRARRLVHALGPGPAREIGFPIRPGSTYSFADGEVVTEPLRATEGGEFHGRHRDRQPAVQVLGRRRRRHRLDPRRRGQGGAAARPQPPDRPADLARVHRESPRRPWPRA